MGWGLVTLSAVQFGLQAYSTIEGAKQAREQAKIQKEDIALQKESQRLSEDARKIQEELAESKVKRDLRHAQAKMLVRQSISGVESSNIFEAMETGIEAEALSGVATQRELSGIRTAQSDIQTERLDLAAGAITAPSDLDVFLNLAGAAISSGYLGYQGYKDIRSPGVSEMVGKPISEYGVNY